MDTTARADLPRTARFSAGCQAASDFCQDADVRYLTIEIPVSLWQRVDGCLDNSVAIDVVNLDMESVTAGSCVRDAGWRAAAAYSGKLDPLGWPPLEHLLPVTLRDAHWDWTLSQLERWEQLETDGTLASARRLIGDTIATA